MILRRIRQIGRTTRGVQRLRVILGVFIQYGYEDVARRLRLLRFFEWPWGQGRKRRLAMAALSAPERLRRALETLGPTFIKLGQLLASQPRLLPPDYVRELRQLQENVTPVPFAEIKRLVETELQWPLEGVFESVDPQPLAAASIAQVHRAKLRDGTPVVIKVQRPGIRESVETDLDILRYLAGLIERHVEEWQAHRPAAVAEELAETITQELDFEMRAQHLERFSRQFAGEPNLLVPRLHRQATSSRLITMDYIDGVSLSDVGSAPLPVDAEELAARLVDLALKQIFVHGFFEGDPHPGNIRVLSDGRLCYLDYGMMGFLDHRGREAFADLVYAFAHHNEVGASNVLLRIASGTAEPSREELEADLAAFIHRHFGGPIADLRFGRLLPDLVALMHHHGLHLPHGFFLMLKTLGQTESIVRQLNPRHDFIKQAQPFVQDARFRRLRPREVLDGIYELGRESSDFIRELPVELRRLLGLIKSGQARVRFLHQGLEPLIETGDRVSNRLSFAVVLASLIVGSSLIVHAGIPPHWHGIPIIGILGFLIAAVMGFWLLLSILRHGRM